MKRLESKIAVVAGASRGAGKGIALALGDAGATVYVAGRTIRDGPKPADGAPGTIEDTAEAVSARGGKGIAARTDCTVEEQVAALFDRVKREHGKVDVLANAVWGAADAFRAGEDPLAGWSRPFWEESPRYWRPMIDGGPFAYLLMSCYAARLMAATGRGLIVGVTDGVIDTAATDDYGGQLVWDLSHQCINRMMRAMSVEGKPRKIAVVTLMPGFMQTERVLAYVKTEEQKKMFRFDKSESVEYVGRAVAALAADKNVMEKTGKIHFVAELAREYGFTDIDGRQVPRFHAT
ncbi:MAG: SDR family NAD(P)-dependent oxidoreductase [Planctomycetes bacterium]|nr:SDR family NAD(P)-dependent oxidoreductase [Planctomycetota bacterium]